MGHIFFPTYDHDEEMFSKRLNIVLYQKLKWKRFLILHCYLWDVYGPYVLTMCADLTVQCLSQDFDFFFSQKL